MIARGGLMRAGDLSGYAPEWVDPIETEYRGATVLTMPPNSYGLYLLLQLNALAGHNIGALGAASPDSLAWLIGAAKAAFAEGRRYVGDPRFALPPTAEALGRGTTEKLRRRIQTGAVSQGVANRGGTAVVTVADGEGNAVVLIQSIFMPFGSGVLDPATGILFNNRMSRFGLAPDDPNRIAPGKRPAHTLSPAMVFMDGRLRYALSSPGGPGQTLTLTAVLSNLLDHGMDLSASVHAPRWSMDPTGTVILETGMPAARIAGLDRLGIDATVAEPGALFFGSVEAVEFMADGALCGVADHRRDAAALGR